MDQVRNQKLPKVPVVRVSSQAEFWHQQENSGAIQAFRQLTLTPQKGGWKKTALPGGKLKPLFKNNAVGNFLPNYGARKVLPDITSPTIEPSSTLQYVMSGQLVDLPPEAASTVRVYLCSSYEDMKAERAILTKMAVPELQRFCGDCGLHFQLVDLHWAVVGGAHNMDSSKELRTKEIKTCQRLSLGPAFVMLLGDKYGPPSVPTTLSLFEFEVLTSVVSDDHLDLLTSCYSRDNNAIPPRHVLSCSKKLDELTILNHVLKESASAALHIKKFTQEQYEQLTVSILQEEIEQGVFPMKDPRHHCLLYRREWQHVDETHPEASSIIDTASNATGKEVRNTESQRRNQSLVERVQKHLGSSACKSYYLKWNEDAGRTWAPTPQFQKYLDCLCTDFVTDCKHLVLQELDRIEKSQSGKLSVYPEVLYQSHLWSSKSAYFHGQKVLIGKIENFLKDPHRKMKPFVIYGPSGSGKTATMAYLAEKLRASSTGSSVIILRFLGTSANSSNIFQVLVSITIQICLAYRLHVPKLDIHMNTLYKAICTFRDVLDEVSVKWASQQPLYILLDGLNQIGAMNEIMRIFWGLSDLPYNVHLILSTTEQIGKVSLIKAFQSFVGGDDNLAAMEPLTAVDATAIISTALQSCERKITSAQENRLLASYEANPNPLYLKVLAQSAQHMKSFDIGEATAQASLEQLFDDSIQILQDKYGRKTIQNILCYLCICGVGIHEKELLDLLLCDEEVMEEVSHEYIQHPDGVAAFPHLLWAAIKNELQDFLAEQSNYGTTVLGWSHDLYSSALANRLGIICPGIRETEVTTEQTLITLALHECISNMYMQSSPEHYSTLISNWDIPDLERTQSSMHTPTDTPTRSHFENTTLLSPQPTNIHNVLKLQNLPIHLLMLIPIGGLQRLIDIMFGSLSWLKTKLMSISIHAVLSDLISVILLSTQFLDEEIIENVQMVNELRLMLEFLQLAQDALVRHPEAITQEVLARLPDLTNQYPIVASLVAQAHTWLSETESPYLSPVYACLTQPGSLLRFFFKDPTHLIQFLPDRNMCVFFCQQFSVDIWTLDTGELLHRFMVSSEQDVNNVFPMKNEEHIIIAHYSHLKHSMELSMWEIETGVQAMQACFDFKFEAIILDPLDRQLMIATVKENDHENGSAKRSILCVDIHTQEVIKTIVVEDVHKDGIAKIIFVGNGKEEYNNLLTIGSKLSNDIAFWDIANEQLCFNLMLDCYVDQVKVVAEDNMAVLGSSDAGAVIIVNLQDGSIKEKLYNANYIGFSSMYLTYMAVHVLLGTRHHGVVIINLVSATQLRAIGEMVQFTQRPSNGGLPVTLPIPSQIALDDEEHFLFIGCWNGAIKIYNIATGDYVDTLNGHTKRINTLQFDSHPFLHSASDDGTSKVWQVAGILARYSARFSKADIEGWDGVKQFETGTSSEEDVEAGSDSNISHPTEREQVLAIVITSKGEYFVTASSSHPVKTWSVESGQLVRTFTEGCQHGACHVYLAYKDQFIVAHCNTSASSCTTSILQVWRRDNGKVVQLSDKPILAITSCETPTGSRIFTVSPSKRKASGIVLGVYGLYEPGLVTSLVCNIYGNMDYTNLRLLGCVSITQDGGGERPAAAATTATTAAACAGRTVTYAVLDYLPAPDVSYFFTFVLAEDQLSMDRHEPLQLDTRSPGCTALAAGTVGLSGAVDGSIVVWDVGAHTVLGNLADPALVTAARDGRLRHPTATGQPAHDGPVTCLRLTGDNRHLVSGGVDMAVKVWNVARAALVSVLGGHVGTILAVDISADARLVASASSDKTLAVWNVEQGNRKSSFYTHTTPTDVAMVTAKQTLIAITEGGNIISLRMKNM